MDIGDLPGTIVPATAPTSAPAIAPPAAPHPRRPPAHKSVSLRHSPPAERAPKQSQADHPTANSSPTGPASDKANPPSSISPKASVNKQSSGESSDAGKWFESTNNKALQRNNTFVDNDPPFFLRNSSSSGTPPEGVESRSAPYAAQSTSMPYRPGLARLGTDGSSTEDFRSVIDDLTVANKKLKQRLKKYEKMYDAHLQDEKLFEVRFHGLPDHKKKELEETLRKFAADLDSSKQNENTQMTYVPPLDNQKSASSTSRFAESGYASMSASGQNSTSAQPLSAVPSGQESERLRMSRSQYNRQQQNIQSYLHDIPAGLLPKSNASMTEKSKKKLVVRRLEQIFAGKRSAPGNHPQPMQQEEVAQSAAMADRQAKEASGQRSRKEGLREARIMAVRSEDEDITGLVTADAMHRLRPELGISQLDFAGNNSPDQRPTRPLDLDPYRAQIPAENMEYIRHLGFTPPDMNSSQSPEEDHGWIYLNLLINMAQLHTINVTTDFVKDALSEYSSKFELSHDGRKIRWKGGHDTSRNSDSSSERYSGVSPRDPTTGSNSISPSKYLKTAQSGESSESIDREAQARQAAKEHDQRKLAYTPIFYHKQDSDEEDEIYNYEASSSNSMFHAQNRGDSSGLGSSAMRSSSSRKKREDGPIIFYNKAKFCTDLSGDRRGLSVSNSAAYKSVTSQPLGANMTEQDSGQNASGVEEPRGPMDTMPMEVDANDTEMVTSSEEELGFSPQDLQNDSSDSTPSMMEFEASGLGGVQPDDNFAIRVRRSQVRAEPSVAARYRSKRAQLYPRKILEALKENQVSECESSNEAPPVPIIKEQILSASRKDLPSSILPPASFLPFDSTSSGDVDSDLEDEVSSNPSSTSSSDRGPVSALQLLNISPMHNNNQNEDANSQEDSDADTDSDASVDFLATARKLDPSTVRASEREYDAALADRLAEDIPAGSSAATAGGGSGFNSPISVVAGSGADTTMENARRSASGSSSTRAQNLKRARTSDSLATTLHQPGKSQKVNDSFENQGRR